MAELDTEDFRLIAHERAGEVIKLRAEVERLIRHLDWIGRVAPPDESATALRAYARLASSDSEQAPEESTMHPLAFRYNRGGFTDGNGCHVVAGDRVEYRFDNHRRGVLDEALHDGDAFVT